MILNNVKSDIGSYLGVDGWVCVSEVEMYAFAYV